MKRISQRGMYNPIADINVIPLMDIVFNLLIVFMLTTPLLEQSINLKLPPTRAGTAVNNTALTTVELDSAGRAFIREKMVTMAELESLAKARIATDPDHGIVIRGDERVPYGRFVELVDRLRGAGVTRLGIMGVAEANRRP